MVSTSILIGRGSLGDVEKEEMGGGEGKDSHRKVCGGKEKPDAGAQKRKKPTGRKEKPYLRKTGPSRA